MLDNLKAIWKEKPLLSILVLSSIARLISVIFSKGYGMHDDHFLVVESAQSWIDGFDYNNWLPENSLTGEPSGHSFFYAGLHYIFFLLSDSIGITSPDFKMFCLRLFHGAFSLMTVYFGYRITELLSGKKEAKIVGLLLGLLWFFPIMTVRNMVEMVCIPFIMMSFWFLLRDREKTLNYVWAGVLIGLAIAIRIQSYLIWGGIGLVLLFEKRILQAALFGIVSIVVLFLTQITDLFLWGYPFAEISQYIFYNSTHYDEYITQSWFNYLLLLGGLLIPPVSLYLFWGFFRTWRKHILIFLPTLIFLIFHSAYPNKQERFVLPMIPLFIMLGVIGWIEFKENSQFWMKREKLYRGTITFFWSLNILALLVVSPAYSKRSRVEAMIAMAKYNDVSGILIERTSNYGCYLMPRFYMGNWTVPHLCYSKEEMAVWDDEKFNEKLEDHQINYALVLEEKEIDERLSNLKIKFPEMSLLEVVEPSHIDKLLHFLNPRNENEEVYIYKLR